MGTELLGAVGGVTLGLLWILWRLDWKLQNLGQRWDSLPLLEKMGAVFVVIGWTVLVKAVAWYGAP